MPSEHLQSQQRFRRTRFWMSLLFLWWRCYSGEGFRRERNWIFCFVRGVPFMGRIPLDQELMRCCEDGTPYLAGIHQFEGKELEVGVLFRLKRMWKIRRLYSSFRSVSLERTSKADEVPWGLGARSRWDRSRWEREAGGRCASCIRMDVRTRLEMNVARRWPLPLDWLLHVVGCYCYRSDVSSFLILQEAIEAEGICRKAMRKVVTGVLAGLGMESLQ